MAILLTQCSSTRDSQFMINDHAPFGVCYAKVLPDQVRNYRMVIIEPDYYTKEEIAALRATGTKIIAYMTLGEVDPNRWYYSLLEKHGFLGINKNWKSSYIDLENEQVRELILSKVLPEIMQKRVDGLFLDTVDAVSPETERGYLQPFMVELIRGIRDRYPEKVIIQNSGLFLLDKTKGLIDAFLTEALASDFDFSKKEYKVRSADKFNERLSYLDYYSKESETPFFILEFADLNDKRAQLVARLDTLKRPYFISNIGLSELPVDPEPVSNSLKKKDQ